METPPSDIPNISNELKTIIFNKRSIVFNIIAIIIFILFLVIFVHIFRDDKKRYTKKYILRKLLFIKRNT